MSSAAELSKEKKRMSAHADNRKEPVPLLLSKCKYSSFNFSFKKRAAEFFDLKKTKQQKVERKKLNK